MTDQPMPFRRIEPDREPMFGRILVAALACLLLAAVVIGVWLKVSEVAPYIAALPDDVREDLWDLGLLAYSAFTFMFVAGSEVASHRARRKSRAAAPAERFARTRSPSPEDISRPIPGTEWSKDEPSVGAMLTTNTAAAEVTNRVICGLLLSVAGLFLARYAAGWFQAVDISSLSGDEIEDGLGILATGMMFLLLLGYFVARIRRSLPQRLRVSGAQTQ